ncbi:MAG: hypothetical protein Q9222_004919 [Ikaeria aurantiellina]
MARTAKVKVPIPTTSHNRPQQATKDSIQPASSGTTVADGDSQMEDVHVSGQDEGHVADKIPENPEDDSSDTIDSDADAGLELLGQGMKALVTVVQDLSHLGVEDLVLPLPKICVLGDQSTGKSSLIEGISGIKVPRNVGTCTRCPLEINLTTDRNAGSVWECSIYLAKNYMYEGHQQLLPFGKSVSMKGEGATRSRPLGPWTQQFPESSLFFKTRQKDDVRQALHLAQMATLNPGSDPAKFFPGKAAYDDRMQVKFSPNIVRVDISSPDVPNLSFYDLPGVINQAEVPEEEYLVKLVTNLVKSYIMNDSCINLLAIPMTDDPANSTASKLVQELNAQDRTIGVLTKPDRVQHGESSAQWIDILQGKKFRLGHGYYVVKNNPDPEVTHAVAREEEEEFFNRKEPWVKTLSSHQERFGTLKLQRILSKRLTAQIKTSLPQITERVRTKTSEIITRLQGLPEPPKGNLSMKVLEKIMAFQHAVHSQLNGGSEEYPFLKQWYAAAVRFKDTLAYSYPRLKFADQSSNSSSQLAYRLSATPTPCNRSSEVIPIDSDGEGVAAFHSTPTSTPQKRKQPGSKHSQASPLKRSRLQDIPKYVPSPDAGNTSFNDSNVDRVAPFAKRFTLSEIRNILQDAHIGLPNQIDPKATKRMIKESLVFWDQPLDDLLEFTNQECLAIICNQAFQIFSIWQGTQIFDLIIDACKSFFSEKSNSQAAAAKRVLALERQLALTLHEDAMRTASERALATLENGLHKERAKAFLAKTDANWEEDLTDRVRSEKISKVTDAQLGPNPYIHELRALADVRGYYECAFSRFVDVISRSIQGELFMTCREEIGTVLKQRIGLEEKDAEQRCAILLAVDPDSERIRAELTKQKENLEKALAWLESQ